MSAILTLNAGSSSLKFALFEAATLKPTVRGQVRNLQTRPVLEVAQQELPLTATGQHAALEAVLHWVKQQGGDIECVAHRVVHGGHAFTRAVPINASVMQDLWQLATLAPLHQPANLQDIEQAMKLWPLVPHIACFDTGFHATVAPVQRRFAIPRAWHDKGLERYGFHGLSYAHIAGAMKSVLPADKQGRVIVAHLGSGASMCALKQGKSYATTMGLTALDGLMMATRSGSIDPGLVLHLIRQEGLTPEEVETMLYKDSGLKGVSGATGDMQALLASPDEAAEEAIDLFVASLSHHVGGLSMALGGLDALVFTAGIGEHAAPIRARLARAMEWLGADLDEAANTAHAPVISSPQSRVALAVIPTDEESTMAHQALECLGD
ncbi:acetate/propionate family kinase [bacterium]|nr:acetate/propionate family kinase [bacterium]